MSSDIDEKILKLYHGINTLMLETIGTDLHAPLVEISVDLIKLEVALRELPELQTKEKK